VADGEREWQGDLIDVLAWHLFETHMRQRRLSPATIRNYHSTLKPLSLWLAARGGAGLFCCTPAQIELWLAGFADPDTCAASTHATHARRARTFFTWASAKDYIDGPSPMAGMQRVQEGEKVIPLPDVADLLKVLATVAKGKTFQARRDHAIMRVLLESGTPRAGAMASLLLADVDMRGDSVKVLDKGSRERLVPFGSLAQHALVLYMRERAKHSKAKAPQLFIGKKGRMSASGIWAMLERRCRQAGVPNISPHKWRHYTAHEWFLAGGSERDAMALFGWKSSAMAHRYASAAAASRAQQHSRELSLADRISA
jgi:site-specific recombinase XerD